MNKIIHINQKGLLRHTIFASFSAFKAIWITSVTLGFWAVILSLSKSKLIENAHVVPNSSPLKHDKL